MRSARIQLGVLLLEVSCALAQTVPPANVQNIEVSTSGSDVRVALTLSTSSIKPSVIVATNPDRLVIELPNTLSDGKQKHVAIHGPGVRGVRVALYQADPPVTHVVVDLEQGTPYRLLTQGNQVTLVLSGMSVARSEHNAPARAVSGGLIGIFRSGSRPLPPSSTPSDTAQLPVPTDSGSSPRSTQTPAATDASAGNPTSTTASAEAQTPAPVHTAGAGASFPPASIATPPVNGNTQTTAALPAATSPADSAASQPVTPPQAVTTTQPTTPAQPTEASSVSGKSLTIADTSEIDKLALIPIPEEPKSPPPPDTSATDQTLLALQAADPNLRTVFRVKYVADGVAYLDGGTSSGLGESMKLEIRDSDLPVAQGTIVDPNDPRVVAELQVTGVAETSSVADIHTPKRPVKVGDLAYLSAGDAQALIQQRTLSATRKYPAVVTFTDNEAMDEEAHDEVPRPPLPSVNRARGMFGFDYMGTVAGGSTSMTSNNVGVVMRADITRLNGTYWNVRGYWRGRLTTESAGTQNTLQDLINRTYHLSMTYDNPNSRLVAGFGRLYLPYAPSLDTIDGGYVGARLGHGSTLGIFAGSTPDPTSYSYNPDGKMGGFFVNFEGGSYDATHYTSTLGFGVNTLKWQITRPFVFFENSISYKRTFSIYDSMQLDSPSGTQAAAAPGAGLGRNFLTIRIQPHPRIEFDVNHTYFRDIPTFDPQLVGTGLLDKYLFQGFSVGARVEVVKHIWVYSDIGQSNRTGDAKNSLNESFGITFNRIPKLNLHTDLHYSRFNSAFGSGSYRALSVTRNLSEAFQLSLLLGDQSFSSTLTSNNSSKFINANVGTNFGLHYFLQGGFTMNRGSMNYNQWMFTMGYRFDNRGKHQ